MRYSMFRCPRPLQHILTAFLAALAMPAGEAGPAGLRSTELHAAAGPRDQLGERVLGSYPGQGGAKVVVGGPAGAAPVSMPGVRAGAAHDTAALRSAVARLERTAAIPGTTWKIEPESEQLVVTADSTVTGAERTRLESAVAALGVPALVEDQAGAISPELIGGNPVVIGPVRCSAAFNVASKNRRFFLTAGHCANQAAEVYADAGRKRHIGTRIASRFPGHDYAIIRTDSGIVAHGAVALRRGVVWDISHARNAVVGEVVALSGGISGVRLGRVTGVGVTVNYPGGTVRGMTETTICSALGDSGGAVFSGRAAIAIHSGSTGGCGGTNRSYHQPVTTALAAFHVRVY